MAQSKKTMTLAEFVKSRQTLSPLMEGREKLETKDIKDKEITITDFDIFNFRGRPAGVFITAEHPDKFTFSGQVITSIFEDIINAYGEDNYKAELAKGEFKCKLTTKKSESGFSYTNMEVIA